MLCRINGGDSIWFLSLCNYSSRCINPQFCLTCRDSTKQIKLPAKVDLIVTVVVVKI